MGTQSHGTQREFVVTVLIALYKSGEFIESKINSLKMQTIFKESQIIFLNCQNHDNESAYYQDFAKDNDNVIDINFPERISLYKSWNIGIQSTKSKYITNYNADDQWHPEYLEKCCKYLDQNQDVSIVSTGVLVTDIPNQLWPNWKYFGKMPFHAYPLSSAGPCPVWRRCLHDRYGYFGDYDVIGDARMWEKYDSGNEKFGLIDENLALYYTSPNSLERRRDPETGQLLRDLDLEKNN